MANNIFSSLARYATRQEENFLTEAFVYLLNLMLEREVECGRAILANLCGDKVAGWLREASSVSIVTQFSVAEGRPDIVIEIDAGKMIFLEVKHDSSLGVEQLERYYAHLESHKAGDAQLILLTRSRHSIQQTSLERALFHHICWYEISGWLSEVQIEDEVTDFLVRQFLTFLKEKEMSMEKVTWEYIQGVPAMLNLVNMISTAVAEASPESSVRKTVGASWAGFYINGQLFVGFRFANSLVIVFENDNGNNPTFKRDLSLEQAHFFSLTAGEQLECLIEFIRIAQYEFLQNKS
jgi:hypothetical protein